MIKTKKNLVSNPLTENFGNIDKHIKAQKIVQEYLKQWKLNKLNNERTK